MKSLPIQRVTHHPMADLLSMEIHDDSSVASYYNVTGDPRFWDVLVLGKVKRK
jgi:hypothetical protein